jgi:hypothetical protein
MGTPRHPKPDDEYDNEVGCDNSQVDFFQRDILHGVDDTKNCARIGSHARKSVEIKRARDARAGFCMVIILRQPAAEVGKTPTIRSAVMHCIQKKQR